MRTLKEIKNRLNYLFNLKCTTYSTERKRTGEIKVLFWILGQDIDVNFMMDKHAYLEFDRKEKLEKLKEWLKKHK